MPDAYVERLAAILRTYEGHTPHPGVPAIVWGSSVRSTEASGAWDYAPRLNTIKYTLKQGGLSKHEYLRLYSTILAPFEVRHNFFRQEELEIFKCYRVRASRSELGSTDTKNVLNGARLERTGRFPGLPDLLRYCNTRSHLTVLMDFMAHFCRPPYCPASILISFGRAYAEYRAITFDEPIHVSAEAGLLFFHATLQGGVVCRFDDKIEQFRFHVGKKDEAPASSDKRSRPNPRKNASPGVIMPARRALYRLNFLVRLGYRLVPPGDQQTRFD